MNKVKEKSLGLRSANEARRYYNTWSRYDSALDNLGCVTPLAVVDGLMPYLGIKQKILDVGCGTGLIGKEFKRFKLGGTLVGVDIAENRLRDARQKRITGKQSKPPGICRYIKFQISPPTIFYRVPLTYNHDHEHEIAVFAQTNFRNQRRRFGIKTDDRRRHMYIIGKTGMGKTNLLENLVYNDIMAGHGVGIVDPHGDFAERILEFIPSNRVNDVVYFNPSDVDYPIAFNILETVDESHKHLIASGLMGVFKKMYAESWGPRLEHVVGNQQDAFRRAVSQARDRKGARSRGEILLGQ